MIQAYYKYKPASFGALALLVCADSKDRFTQLYIADMLRLPLPAKQGVTPPPRLPDIFSMKKSRAEDARKADVFVDNLIQTFGGGKK